MMDLLALKEKFPVIFAQFPGETIKDMALHRGTLVVVTDKSAYVVDKTGRKTKLKDGK